jgi:filamentous haemagglutinin family N-terminal domain
MYKYLHRRSRFPLSLMVLPACLCTTAQAEITLDGSMGPSGALAGPDFQIGAELGQQRGANLFHSFGMFNINRSESATFSGPTSVDNILGRVTGGSASSIDGLLRSTIPDANLFLLNPAGILFGPNATLDVQGSFHASTADFIRLEDGVQFNAVPSPDDALLTTAPPEAFGFLGENPAGISVQGSFLQVPEGKTLSVVGGDIKVADGSLYAPAGRIDIASVASKGEVVTNAPDLGASSFEKLGKIEISHSSSSRPEIAGDVIGNVDASGEGGGRVFIRGGEFVADSAFVFADTRGGGEGQGIDIGVTGQLTVRNGALITVDTLGPGRGGNLTIDAHDVLVDGFRVLGEGENQFTRLSQISASSCGCAIKDPAKEDRARAGDLSITTERLEVSNGGQIGAATFGPGQGGNLKVNAKDVVLQGTGGGFPSGLFVTAEPGSSGDGGDLALTTNTLQVREGAVIAAGTSGPGRGGNLTINAHDVLVDGFAVLGEGENQFTQLSEISASSFSAIKDPGKEDSAKAGDLILTANRLELRNGGQIAAITFGPGRGGNVTVNATNIELRDGSTIAAESKSAAPDAGESGSISITATDTLRLFNGSSVSVKTEQADAGSIDLHVGNLLHLRDQGSIAASVADGRGDGGNIRIDPRFTVLDRGSEIVAQARKGRGGNIEIVSDFFFKSPDSEVSASSKEGIQGTVEIDSPDIDITGGITVLPASFLEAAALLSERCAVRTARSQSSLILGGRGGLPIEPGTSYLPAFYMDMPESTHVQRSIRIEDGATGDFYSPELVDTPFESFGLGCENW